MCPLPVSLKLMKWVLAVSRRRPDNLDREPRGGGINRHLNQMIAFRLAACSRKRQLRTVKSVAVTTMAVATSAKNASSKRARP